MIYRDHKNKKTITIDFRETAPASATKDMYNSNLNEKKYVSFSGICPLRPYRGHSYKVV